MTSSTQLPYEHQNLISTTETPTQSMMADQMQTLSLEPKAPSLFALVIGINEYKSHRVNSLLGAVPDALAVKHYLEDDLGVPSTQIKVLLNEQATRKGIIDEILSFETNDLIQEGDPIVIFFAGHGATSPAPKSWEAGGSKIQLLVPYDFDIVDGDQVHGLPDRTIGALLDKVAHKKGDNITVIFDCCHSGSGTRSQEEESKYVVRGIGMVRAIPEDLDRYIWENGITGRGVMVASQFLRTGLASHVLLAACGSEERAREEAGQGLFTQALLDTLTKAGANKLTYTQLIERLPILPSQSPQCEGVNRKRIFFDSKVVGRQRVVYVVHRNNGAYMLDAGAAESITDGAVFAIFGDMDCLRLLGTLVASQPTAFTTKLIPSAGMPQLDFKSEAFAVQVRAGDEEDLRLYVDKSKLKAVLEPLIKEMEAKDASGSRVNLVKKDKAELGMTMEGDSVVFKILNPHVTKYGLKRFPFRSSLTKEDMYRIIKGAAHYHWHLRRAGYAPNLHYGIKIDFNKLEATEEFDDYLQEVRRPVAPNLVQKDIVDLVVDPKNIYGVTIRNTTKLSLYPSVFYFDNTDLSIVDFYLPPIAKGRVDPPLQPGECLTIGYGSSGGAPISFSLRDDQDIDVGFLKVFISTEPIDLSGISQDSPFEKSRRVPKHEKANGLWHTMRVPIVQRRA